MTTSQTNLTKPQHLTSLATSAILVCVELTGTNLQKADRKVSNEVQIDKKAVNKAGRYVKNLLADDGDLKQVTNYRGIFNNWFNKNTYPWGGGWALLPMSRYPEFMQGYEDHVAVYKGVVENFLSKYEDKISNMAFELGTMFDRNDYPTIDELRGRFSMKLYKSEVPLGDFRVQVSQDLADDLYTHYTRQTEGVVTGIVTQQSEELVELMRRISHSCGTTESVGKDGEVKVRRNKIYETTIQQAMQLCDTIAKFNPANSVELIETRDSLDKILRDLNVDALKASDSLRVTTKEKIDDILAKFG